MTSEPSGVQDFRQLIVWQRALDLSASVYDVARPLRRAREFELAHQLNDAAMSVHANIAEGNGRAHRRDYSRFVGYSRGSVHELRSHLAFMHRVGLATSSLLQPLDSDCEELSKMLLNLYRSLRR